MSNEKKVGQPTKYKKEYCQMLIEHGKQGLSYESFAGVAGVKRSTLYEWEKVHPEFLEAKEIARSACELFWEKLGLAGTLGRVEGFNATTWIFNMKNRFRWLDRLPGEPGDVNLIQNNLTVNQVDQEKAVVIDEFFSEAIPDPESEYIKAFKDSPVKAEKGLLVKKK